MKTYYFPVSLEFENTEITLSKQTQFSCHLKGKGDLRIFFSKYFSLYWGNWDLKKMVCFLDWDYAK